MSTTIDRRIADRRRTVREAGARKRLRWSIGVLIAVALVGVAGWFVYQSSHLTVRNIVIDGQVRSAAVTTIEQAGVVPGVPTINVDGAGLETDLLRDPWIADARVTVTWPGSVTVEILEHRPVAWVESPSGWMLASAAGTIIATAPQPDAAHPHITVDGVELALGEDVDRTTLAALAFLRALPPNVAAGASVGGRLDDMTALVAGHEVVLGYGADMEDKARAVTALLATAQPEGAVISVVSPERPAVKPRRQVETREEVLGADRDSG